MKQITALSLIFSMFIFTSCGVNYALMLNTNNNTTQVTLSQKNFRIVDKVKGSAEVSYVLAFGGAKKKRLFSNAYFNLVENANLEGSKALANLVTEEHVGGVPPFYYVRTITVTANVIEFTEN